MRPRRCAPSCAPAVTWSTCGSRPPTSCPRCWRRTGPAPGPSSPTSSRRSAWRSSPATRPRPRPPTWAKSGWPRSAPSTATPAAAPPPSCWPGCAPRRPAPSVRPSPRRLRDAVLAAVGVLTALNTSVKNLDRSSAAHLGEHPDGAIFTSLPRSGQINAAQVLAEWGDTRQAYEHPDSVAALAGVTPVTKESGKHRAVHFRWACNKRFRNGDHHLRRQQPARQPLGRRDLQRRPRQRQRPPARHPRPRPRLDPRHLALLARRRPLRPRQTRSRRRSPRANGRTNRGLRLTQGVSWVVPPGCCGRFPGGVRLRVPWFCGPVRGSWAEMTPRQAEDRRWSWRFR